MLSFCCQLTGIEQGNPRAHFPSQVFIFLLLSIPLLHLQGKSQFFLEASYLMSQGILSFLPAQRGMCCCTVREKKAFRSITPSSQHATPRSHLAVCQAASIIPSSTAKWHFSQKTPSSSRRKALSVQMDVACWQQVMQQILLKYVLHTHRRLLEWRTPKILSLSLKFWT